MNSGSIVSPSGKSSLVSIQSTRPSSRAMNPSRLATMWIVTRESVFPIIRHGGGSSEVGSGCFCEGVVRDRAIKARRVNKAVPIFFHVHRIQQQFLELGFAIVFDQHPGRAIKAPHLEAGI